MFLGGSLKAVSAAPVTNAITNSARSANAITRASTNAVTPPPAIPHSVFTIPTSKEEGRDPFYPKTDRVLGGGDPVKPTPAAPVFTLVLNGLSGAEGHRLAMINGYTLATGEEADVPTPGGRVHVRCITIRDESAVVEVGGKREELHLRQNR